MGWLLSRGIKAAPRRAPARVLSCLVPTSNHMKPIIKLTRSASPDNVRPEFTLIQGIAIQEEHIDRLRTVLLPDTLELVRDMAGLRNAALPAAATGFHVWRGNQIDGFVSNVAIMLAAGRTHSEAFEALRDRA